MINGMKTEYQRYFMLFTIIMLITWTISCSGKAGSTDEKIAENKITATDDTEIEAKLIILVSPEENTGFSIGDDIKLVIKESREVDSIRIWFDGQLAATLYKQPWDFTIQGIVVRQTGRKALKVVAYRNSKRPQTITRFMVVYSDSAPKHNGYRVVNSYPHDATAFTQGLVYDQGVLYEGTGQETHSSLRKIKLETGEVISQLNLESDLFGEGVTVYGDRIFQLTWQSKIGFVYDKSTFRMVNRIYYQTEGWGLTTMNDILVMSDGTNILYFVEPESFRVVSRIEVYDNKIKVDSLNELEFINGEIWANIWQKDVIARIDPESGKVIAYIDLKGLCKETDTSINVLNGIAYDSTGNRIFVTGKNWPRLYEITVTE